MNRGRWYWLLGLGALMGLLASAQTLGLFGSQRSTYLTWESLEPDIWSSAWLIARHIEPDARIEILPADSDLNGGISFAVPEGDYARDSRHSAFSRLLIGHDLDDPVLKEMGELLSAIEINSWNTGAQPRVAVVEQNFRQLQDQYSRAYVPPGCYARFFDALYADVEAGLDAGALNASLAEAVRDSSCAGALADADVHRSSRVREVKVERLLSEIAMGKDVVFVDTRERAEYRESHIPGARRITLRELDEDHYEALAEADLVISYCVKDFRGYEVARQLRDNGVRASAVMKPHGLAGWKKLQLPLTEGGESEPADIARLQQCARDADQCLNKSS